MKRSKRYRTGQPGVAYREHESRKYNGKPDRYYILRYRVNGRLKEEGLGWQSQQKGLNTETARAILAKLRSAQTKGEDGQTLKERRKMKVKRDEAEELRREKEARDQITFAHVFEKHYLPQCKADGKKSCNREQSLFKHWINPVIGQTALIDISPIHLEKLKSDMKKGKGKTEKKQSARSIQYALSTVRQTFNFARNIGVFRGDNPVKKIKMPKFDNVRRRFLTRHEADELLDALKAEDLETYQMALISLHCGLRASEVFALEWIDINTQDKTIMVRDAKAGTRVAHMTERVNQVFLNKKPGKPHDLIYPGPNGQRREIPATFKRVVDELGLNDGIQDRRQKVVFHSLRHTFASWMLQAGEDIYVIAKMTGHKTLSMAGRYTHVANPQKQQAIKSLEEFINEEPDKSESKTVPLQKNNP